MIQLEQLLCLLEYLYLKRRDLCLLVHDHLFGVLVVGMVIGLILAFCVRLVGGDIRESPFEGGAPNAGGYIDLSYSAGLDPSGGSATPPPPRASNSRLNRAISASYLPLVPSVLTMTKRQKLTLREFSGEPSLAHTMIDGLIQVPVLAVVLPISTLAPPL